jgi:hypothetical protein
VDQVRERYGFDAMTPGRLLELRKRTGKKKGDDD